MKYDFSQEIHVKMIFSVYMYNVTIIILPFCKKKIRDNLLPKNTLKG